MGAIVYCVQLFGFKHWVTLLIQVPLGIAVYAAGSLLFHIDSFHYALDIIKRIVKKRNG
jgi:hypothetical protein